MPTSSPTPATESSIALTVEGMTCASCVGRVERALGKVEGVASAAVNLATERAHVVGVAPMDADALIHAVSRAGYTAAVLDSATPTDRAADDRQVQAQAVLHRDVWIAAVLTLPVFILEMGSHMLPAFHMWVHQTLGNQTSWVIQSVLTTLVLLGPGRRFYQHGIPALMRLAPDMNSLVAVGTLAAYGFSLVATYFPAMLPSTTVAVYFEAAAVIVTLILLGRYLEARAKSRTSQAIKRLVQLQAKTARVLRGSAWLDIPIADVVPGERIAIKPGERIPVDGTVVDGTSYVDESMISGEPVPVQKAADAPVVAGTINQTGALRITATAVGEGTVLAQIIRMVEQAQQAKLPIQAVVDRVTLWFVPLVMLVAASTFAVWFFLGPAPSFSFGLVNAVAVLIIACPCAMGLATPTSIMVGTGRGAELGVLFRQGDALQRLKDARVVAVDKTGTLTEGKPTLTDFDVAAGFSPDDVLAKVAAVEARSEHPIARAIVQAALARGLSQPDVQRFDSITGLGVAAWVAQTRVEIGADRFMARLGLDVSTFSATARRLGDEGKTPLYAAIDGRLAAIIAVADPIKSSTLQAITTLHALGLKVAMITGDNQRTAQVIAKRLGIDEVVAEVLPEGKVDAVKRLQREHGVLAYVGDGINDAPALAQADVGIAIGTGTDIAIESADVVLMSGSMSGVPTAIALSKATIGNIHQNLFWAFAYNAALVPVAAGALYPINGVLLSPIFAAGAMALSSVFVLGNALRLKRFRPL